MTWNVILSKKTLLLDRDISFLITEPRPWAYLSSLKVGLHVEMQGFTFSVENNHSGRFYKS